MKNSAKRWNEYGWYKYQMMRQSKLRKTTNWVQGQGLSLLQRLVYQCLTMVAYMHNWIDEALNERKPRVSWIDLYIRGDDKFVDGHFRTDANQTLSDNLGDDVDGVGITSFFDVDADGDGIAGAIDLDDDVIVDIVETDEDGRADTIHNWLCS